MKFKQHPLSAAFPAMTDEEYSALVADIEANGQRDPIVLHEGMVLDGWNRARACDQLAAPLRTTELPEGVDPVAFVLSRNLHRRHLTASQRAMAVAACARWLPNGGDRAKQSAAAALCADAAETPPKSLAALADDAGVSRRTMAQAAKVVKQAVPEVAKAVKDGDLPVERAAELAALPAAEQVQAIAKQPAEQVKPKERKPRAASTEEVEQLRIQLAAANEAITELTDNLRSTVDDNNAMGAVFEADDKLAEAMKQNAQLRAEVSTLRERVNGLMNEKNQQIRLVKHWKGRAEKAEKLLGDSGQAAA